MLQGTRRLLHRHTVQVMALTEGQHVELDVLVSLLAAVRAARERAGTLGVEQRGEGPLRAAVPVQPPHLAANGAVCASARGVMYQAFRLGPPSVPTVN